MDHVAGWHPCNLAECVDSQSLAVLLMVLSAVVVAWYFRIMLIWREAALDATAGTCRCWQWLVVVFVVCATGGYGALVVSMFAPKAAVILRLSALCLQNLACWMFVSTAKNCRFRAIGRLESIGDKITKAITEPGDLSDRELATLARQLVGASLQRQNTKDWV